MRDDERSLAAYARKALGDMGRGELKVDPAVKEQLADLLEVADGAPDGHPLRLDALREAAGVSAFVRDAAEATVPFGEVESTTTFMNTEGVWMVREKDYRGTTRETVSELQASPAPVDQPATFDPETVNTLEDARGISPENWMKLSPERREQLLREAS